MMPENLIWKKEYTLGVGSQHHLHYYILLCNDHLQLIWGS